MNLSLAAMEREIKIMYIRLARKYHPDKYNMSSNEVSEEMTRLEAQQHFQMISNTYEYLRT